MIKLNMHEAKTHLSRYIDRIAKGETVILCKRNVPVAEIRAIHGGGGRRRIGLAKGRFEVGGDFFEPLPDEIIKSFQGESR